MIVVAGGTGRVGRQVAAQLGERGLPVRVISRGLTPAQLPPGAEAARADLTDPASLEAPLQGADALFLLWPFTSPELTAGLAPKVAEAAARHAGRIVYLSGLPAADRPNSFWALVEQAIEDCGAEWTFLRPTGFAANTLMWADQIRAGDVVRWPSGPPPTPQLPADRSRQSAVGRRHRPFGCSSGTLTTDRRTRPRGCFRGRNRRSAGGRWC